MYYYSPNTGEQYYLQLLLISVTGLQLYEELYLVNNICYLTYQAICIVCSLAENDHEQYYYFNEAILFTSSRGLQTLFLMGLYQVIIADLGKI